MNSSQFRDGRGLIEEWSALNEGVSRARVRECGNDEEGMCRSCGNPPVGITDRANTTVHIHVIGCWRSAWNGVVVEVLV